MIEDDVVLPEEPLEDEPELDAEALAKKNALPKDLIGEDDDDVESLDKLEEEELEDDEEPFDDITNQ